MKSLNSYLKDAWADLSSDEGWWRAILVLGLLNCIPLVGQVFACGFLYDWAKEAAWGMRSGISHSAVDIGRRGRYGLMVFGVCIIWVAPVMIVAQLLRLVPVMGGVLCFLMEIIAILVTVVASAAALRSIIYERMAPGLQFKRVFRMVRRDPGGLSQALGIALLNVVLAAAALFVLLLPAVPFVGVAMSSTTEMVLGANLPLVVVLGMLFIVISLVVWVAGSVFSTLILALYARAIGYWIAQFEPAKWRTPTDPMPFELEMAEEKKKRAEEKARVKAEKKASRGKKNTDAAESEANEDTGEEAAEKAAAGDDPEKTIELEPVEAAEPGADAGEQEDGEQKGGENE